MSLTRLRQKYLQILSGFVSGGAVGVSLALGASAPAQAEPHPLKAQPRAAVADRLAAIRDAVSDAAAGAAQRDLHLAWWAWRNGGGGWRNGGGAWRNGGGGWGNGWHNGGWHNYWRNW